MSGILFRPELARLVERGVKTMTRRPVRVGQRQREIGHVYAVQPGRGIAAICRVRILDIRREQLGDITARDARREGFDSREQFFDYWRGLYPDTATPPALRDIVEQIAAAEAADEAFGLAWVDDDELSARALTSRLRRVRALGLAHPAADGRWSVTEQGADVIDSAELDLQLHAQLSRQVHVISFELERDEPRFLAPAIHPAGNTTDRIRNPDVDGNDPSDHGYTIAGDELVAGTVIDPAVLSKHWREHAEGRHRKARAACLEERLARARRQAQAAGVDIARHERAIAERIERLERTLDRDAGEAA